MRVSNFQTHLKRPIVRMGAIAPGPRSRSLKIDLRGVIAWKDGVFKGILRWIINVRAVQRCKLRSQRIALVESKISVLVSNEVGRGKVLTANVMRTGTRELDCNQV